MAPPCENLKFWVFKITSNLCYCITFEDHPDTQLLARTVISSGKWMSYGNASFSGFCSPLQMEKRCSEVNLKAQGGTKQSCWPWCASKCSAVSLSSDQTLWPEEVKSLR